MESKYEKKLLADAMNVAQIAKLPQGTSPYNLLWIDAIAKIQLVDGSYGYGIVKRNNDLSITYKYINGNTSAIMKIVEVYPYITIDARKIKRFSDQEDVQARIDYLKSLQLPYKINFDDTSLSHLNKEIVKASLYKQLNSQEY